jgi:hypothetical protein
VSLSPDEGARHGHDRSPKGSPGREGASCLGMAEMSSRRTFQKKRLTSAFIASIVSILVTLLATVLAWANRSGNNSYAVPALYVFVIAGLLLLGLIHFRAYIADLLDVRQELRDYELMRRCVPNAGNLQE